MRKFTKYLIYLYAIPVLFLIESCSTTYIAEIRPAGGVATFSESGRTVAKIVKSGIEMYLTYLDNPPGILLFDVQAANGSGYPVKINATDIYFVPVTNLADNSNTINKTNITRALDPKNEIRKVEKEIEDENSGYKAGALIDLGLTLLGAVIYSAVEDDEEPVVYAEMAGNFILRRADAAVDHDRFVEDLQYRREFLEKNTLKDTTIADSCLVYGAVMLPANALPKYFKVVVPVNGTYFEFPYEVIIRKH